MYSITLRCGIVALFLFLPFPNLIELLYLKKTTTLKVGFMRRFGYLASNSVLSETIYDDTAFVSAIKNMQKFGGLDETGELDGDTIKVSMISSTYICRLCAYTQRIYLICIISNIILGGLLQLLTKPRCGVIDMRNGKNSTNRFRRFVIGSRGWRKRRLTYL